MKTYLIVTNDKFEHPVKEIVGSKKVAEFLGLQRQTFSKYMTNGFPKCHEYKAVVIKEVQFETEEEKRERKNWHYKKWNMHNDRKEYMREYMRYKRKLRLMKRFKESA